MKKSDLKTGMVVEFRNGVQDVVVMNPICENKDLIGINGGYMPLKKYNEDLAKIDGDSIWDIMKVYSLEENFHSLFTDFTFALSGKKLIWEREEAPTEMTIAEIEEKLGIKNLKIIKEKENE